MLMYWPTFSMGLNDSERCLRLRGVYKVTNSRHTRSPCDRKYFGSGWCLAQLAESPAMTIVNESLNRWFPFHSLPEDFPSQCVILDTGKSIAELLFCHHSV